MGTASPIQLHARRVLQAAAAAGRGRSRPPKIWQVSTVAASGLDETHVEGCESSQRTSGGRSQLNDMSLSCRPWDSEHEHEHRLEIRGLGWDGSPLAQVAGEPHELSFCIG